MGRGRKDWDYVAEMFVSFSAGKSLRLEAVEGGGKMEKWQETAKRPEKKADWLSKGRA